MTLLCGGYVGARSCTGGPQPGVKGGMAWFLGAYAQEGGRNLGIYNCRPVIGGSITSLHGEGRAGDWGTPVENNWSWDLVELLRMNSAELGIQCIIHRRRIWSSSYCTQGWRYYSGVAAHFDHAHIEWTWEAARRSEAETVALFQRVLGDPSPVKGDGHVIPPPVNTTPGVTWRKIPWGGVSELGTRGEQCRKDQADLIDTGFPVGTTGADGYFGELSVKAAREFQFAAGITVDGAFGPQSREFIHRVPSYSRANHRSVQQRLKDRGWSITVDGVWGPKSRQTLSAFQREKGLTVDGQWGPQSWTALWVRPL
jgi:hypothetical protein